MDRKLIESSKRNNDGASIDFKVLFANDQHLTLVRVMQRLGVDDVETLKKDVERNHYKSGYLIGTGMIDKSAKKKAEDDYEDDYPEIIVASFDELIERDMLIIRYLDKLENDYRSIDINNRYIPLSGRVLGKASRRILDFESDIGEYISRWLTIPADTSLALSGEFGAGKTWVLHQLALRLIAQYRHAVETGEPRPRIPIVIPLRDYTRPSQYNKDVNSLLANFNWDHGLNTTKSAFEYLNRAGRLLLLLDGFDEMSAQMDKDQDSQNIKKILHIVEPNSKMILTCRKEYFEDCRHEVDILIGGAFQNVEIDSVPAAFNTVYLDPLTPVQSEQILKRIADEHHVKEILANETLKDLRSRPLFLELIVEALQTENIAAPDLTNLTAIYHFAIEKKLTKDLIDGGLFKSNGDKWFFLTELAKELFSSRKNSIHYAQFPKKILTYFTNWNSPEIDCRRDVWANEMRGRTLLVRGDQDEDGKYSFAHQSLFHFFLARGFLDLLGFPFMPTTPPPGPGSKDRKEPIKNPRGFRPAGFARIFGKAPCDVNVLRFMSEININPVIMKKVINYSSKNPSVSNYAGGNALTYLKLINEPLSALDLSYACLKGADLSRSDLKGLNMKGANLADANLNFCILENADLSYANLTNAKLQRVEDIYDQAFSSDGTRIAFGGIGGTLWVLNLVTYEIVKALNAGQSQIQKVTWTPCGRYIICGTGGDGIVVWSSATFTQLDISEKKRGIIAALASGGDPMRAPKLLVGGELFELDRLSLNALNIKRISKIHDSTDVIAVAFSHHGDQYALATRRSSDILVYKDNGTRIACMKSRQGAIIELFYSKSDQYLVARPARPEDQNPVCVWDLKNKKELAVLKDSIRINALAVSPGNDKVIGGGEDGKLTVWSLNDGEQINQIDAHSAIIRSIAINPQGNQVSVAAADGTISLWDEKVWQKEAGVSPIKRISLPFSCHNANFKGAKGLNSSMRKYLKDHGAILDDE
jgi:WD40 repeat protein